MASFSNIVCTKELVIGPTCKERVYETAEPMQKDCLENAKLYQFGEYLECFGRVSAGIEVFPTYNPCGGDQENTGARPVNYTPCIADLDSNLPAQCYCSGLAGMVCTTCVKEYDDEEPPSNDPDVVNEQVVVKSLPQITVPHSDFNIPIPKIFGTISVSGNICWLGDARITTNTTRLTAGTQVTITVEEIATCDLMIGVCEGDIENISRIWLNDIMVYNNTTGDLSPSITVNNQELYDIGFTVDIWKGSAAQRINPTMAAIDGFGRTPAYRDLCYLLINNYPMTFSNARLPAITVEVMDGVDTTVRVYDITAITGASDPNVFSVDSVALRAATDGGNWVDLLTMDSDIVTEIDGATSLQITDQGDFLITPDALNIKVVSARIREEQATLALATDGGFLNTTSFDGVTKIVLARNDEVKVVEWNVDALTLELVDTYPTLTPDSFVGVFAANLSYGDDTETDYKFIAVAQETNQLRFVVGNFEDAPTSYVVPVAGTYLDAMIYKTNGSLIVWTDEGGDIVVRQLRFIDGTTETLWTSSTPAYETNPNVNRFFSGFRRYDYIADGAIYSMNLDTGEVTSLGSLLNAPDPSTPLAQFYDGQRGNIVYTTVDGEVCKLFPDVRSDVGANLQEVLEHLDDSVKAPTLFNVSFGGFLLLGQNSALEALEELKTFFNLITINNGSEIKVTSISASVNVPVEEDVETRGLFTQRGQVPEDLTGIAFTYYAGEDGENTQVIRRDVLAGFDDYVANIEDETYILPINTTPLIARRAAERQLLRRLQRQETMNLFVAPALLALEPGDYIFNDVLVGTITLDTQYIGETEGNVDDPDIYTVEPGLDGIPVQEGEDQSVYDDKSPLRVYPIVLNLPPSQNDLLSEVVYVGLVNPDAGAFTPADIFVRGVEGDEISAAPFIGVGRPTQEMMIGRLVTPANYTLTPYTTDETSTLVIEFYKPVAGRVQNRTRDELRVNEQVNLLFVGEELIQYENAEIDMDGKTVTFTGLTRAMFGTLQFTNTHVAGELCAIFDTDSIIMASLGNSTTSLAVIASNGGLSRSANVSFTPLTTRPWDTGGLWVFKVPNGESGEGLWFRLPGSEPFDSTFRNNYQVISANPPTAICILKAPYDPDLFLTKFAEGGFTNDFNDPVVNTNDYIYRMVYYISQDGEGGNQSRYDWDDMVDDGADIDGELHLATFQATAFKAREILGPVTGWRIEEGVDYYYQFKSGLKVIDG
jgi:hypothetical protein